MSSNKDIQYTDESTATLKEGPTTEARKQVEVDVKIIQDLSKQVEKHEEIIKKQTEALDGYEKFARNEITALKIELKKATDLIKEFKRNKYDIIAVLAIFVGIFAFLFIDLQMLKSATGFLRIAGLSIILFAGLLFFITNLSIIAEKWINVEAKSPSLRGYNIAATSALILGILLVGFGDYKNPADIENNTDFIAVKEDMALNKAITQDIDDRLTRLEKKLNDISKKQNNGTQTNNVDYTKKH